jgi:hypothetical protein
MEIENYKIERGYNKEPGLRELKDFVVTKVDNYNLILSIQDSMQQYKVNSDIEEILKDIKKSSKDKLEKIIFHHIQNIEERRNNSLSESRASLGNYSFENGHAVVREVSPSMLPSGIGWRALGMYDPSTHTIYLSNDLSGAEKEFVYWHEVAHSRGIIDERMADSYAQGKTGYSMAA